VHTSFYYLRKPPRSRLLATWQLLQWPTPLWKISFSFSPETSILVKATQLVQTKDLPSPSLPPPTGTISRHAGKSESKVSTEQSPLSLISNPLTFQIFPPEQRLKLVWTVDLVTPHESLLYITCSAFPRSPCKFLVNPTLGHWVLPGLPLAGGRAFSSWLLGMWLWVPLLEYSYFTCTKEDTGESTITPQTGLKGATQSMLNLQDATASNNVLRNYPNAVKLSVCYFFFLIFNTSVSSTSDICNCLVE